ncbi:MAG TPA: ABC transporter ATP-binding protein [Gemmataceae bacterium]|jgi:ABC-type lipoprotein export system ATPase subunit|nr:ABC transporter ATP-binding protein [Gemmataceae bacterium]
MPEPLVRTRELHKSYGSVSVLRGVTLEVQAGERLAVLGKSGSGKSTLLHLLGGLDGPSSGELIVAGRDLGRLTRNERADFRRSTVGIIFQAFHLVAMRTAVENVELPMMFAAVPARERRRQATIALEAVGLGHRLTHRPAELSGGERQRVAVARALVNRPRLLLADEPTGNLDTTTGAEVMTQILQQVKELDAALVLVTHDEELAARSSDRVLHMQDGVVVASS